MEVPVEQTAVQGTDSVVVQDTVLFLQHDSEAAKDCKEVVLEVEEEEPEVDHIL